MPDSKLTARSGLEALAVPARSGAIDDEVGLTLALRRNVAVASVMVRKGQMRRLSQRVSEVFDLLLPESPRRSAEGDVAFVWAGPDHWLAIANDVAGDTFERRLRVELAGLSSISDQSDGRTLIRLAGRRVRDVLAKRLMIDLHPRVFGPDDAAVTTMAHCTVHIWQLDAAPTYEIAISRSLAVDFWRELVDSGAEYGVTVEVDDRSSQDQGAAAQNKPQRR